MSLLPQEPSPYRPENRPLEASVDQGIDRRVQRLQAEVKSLNAVLARKNRELDALHYVWCSGGCDGGVHRFVPGQVTEEVVAAAERNTRRLRSWIENSKLRARYKAERESAGDTKQTDA